MMKRNRMATCLFATLASAVCLAAGAQAAVAAGMYKWTDDKGAVHYSDQMPPDAVNKGTMVFDKQGRAVKKIEPTPTPEQLKAKELEDERRRRLRGNATTKPARTWRCSSRTPAKTRSNSRAAARSRRSPFRSSRPRSTPPT